MSKIKFFFILFAMLIISGCYHLRVNPETLPSETITSKRGVGSIASIIRQTVQSSLNLYILEENNGGRELLTSPYHFATDRGFGQPAGGRRYMMQLKFDIAEKNDAREITVSAQNYEIKTSYAYGLDGKIKTLIKSYPYPEYPGMFDLSFLEEEIDRVATILEFSLKEFK